MPVKDIPMTTNPENTVSICGKLLEIKSTRAGYFRNRTALFYKVIDAIPLPDIFAMDSGTFGDNRDGDKAMMDWLIAVTDAPDLIVNNYDDIDADTIYKLLSIFKRLNRIDEKEVKQKNAEKERKEAV